MNDPQFSSFVQWVFYGLIAAISAHAVGVLTKLKESVDHLNEKVAVIIEKTLWHERELEKHSVRITEIERAIKE